MKLSRSLALVCAALACCALPLASLAQSPSPSPAASPAKKQRNPPYRGNVDTVDAAAKTFTIKGKKATRTFTTTAETKFSKRSGGSATFDDLKSGGYVTGSAKKTGEEQYEAISVKVGPKETAASPAASATPTPEPSASPSPSPSASPAKKSRKKSAKAEASPSPAQ